MQVRERLVVDSSVLFSAFRSPEGGSREVLRRCLRREVTPLVGQKLFLEYVDVIGRPEMASGCPLSAAERKELLAGYLAVCVWIEVFFLWRPNLPDEGDNHVLELAVAGGASVIVTHDVGHFRGELQFPAIRVMTPAQFLQAKR